MEKLTATDLTKLVESVFPSSIDDKRLGILVDIPRDPADDNSDWKTRRQIAEDWYLALKDNAQALGLEAVNLLAYGDVGNNNADLPSHGFQITGNLPQTADGLKQAGDKISFKDIFTQHQLFMAPTEYSTTAPLKNAAKQYGFRAATMPGFAPSMIPALRIDYNEVFRRVSILKEKLDPAKWAEVLFQVDEDQDFKMFFDLRFRNAHLSPGRFPDKSVAGNLPSGETYIVPYEGEQGETTLTEGTLPVQIDSAVLLFTIDKNRAIDVVPFNTESEGKSLDEERDHLRREPAYGNMSELGFGVLADFGLTPINEILLDEKLGFHVAFGRSDHFGGIVGPGDFSSPKEVIHLDRIYIPATQPRIQVKSIIIGTESSETETIMENGKYLIF